MRFCWPSISAWSYPEYFVVHHKSTVSRSLPVYVDANMSTFSKCPCRSDLCCATVCVYVRMCVSDVSNLIVVTPICLPRLSSFTMGRVGIRRFWHSRPGWHAPILKHGCHSLPLRLPFSVYLCRTDTYALLPHTHTWRHTDSVPHTAQQQPSELLRSYGGEINVFVFTCMPTCEHKNRPGYC